MEGINTDVVHAEDSGKIAGQRFKEILSSVERVDLKQIRLNFFDLLAFADIAYSDPAFAVLTRSHLQMRPESGAVSMQQAHIPGLRFICFAALLDMLEEDVAILCGEYPADPFFDKSAPGDTKHGRGAKIDLLDQVSRADSQIADRRQIIQVKIASL